MDYSSCECVKMCINRSHYVEYLVSVVYESNLDPLPILDLTDCVQELRRRGIPLPERGPWDTDPIYREMCQKVKRKHFLDIKYSMCYIQKKEA